MPEAGETVWLQGLSPKTRRTLRREVLDREADFVVQWHTAGTEAPPAALAQHWRKLYEAVKGRSLLLNTFDLPAETFEALL